MVSQIKEAMMAKLTYEMSVDSHYDNFYVLKRDGVRFGHIFCLDENKKKVWSVWIGLNMVAKRASWNEAWNWVKAKEIPDVVIAE